MSTHETTSSLDQVIARARAEARTAAQEASSSADESDEYMALMTRLREASAAADAATLEQTLLFAYARVHLMPPPSYQALAEASGMSYSGVRQRLTPEVMEMVRSAGARPDRLLSLSAGEEKESDYESTREPFVP